MTSQNNRPADQTRRSLPRRDPASIHARIRDRDRSEIEARLRNHDKSVDAHLKNHDKSAAQREKALNEAQARSRARSSGETVRSIAYMPRGAARRGGRRTAIVAASIVSAILILAVVVPPLAGSVFRSLADANPDLMRIGFIADSVGAVMEQRPDTPAGTDPTPVEFAIETGASSAQITDSLVDRGLVTDRLAFMYILVTEGGINDLRAGTHVLDRTMSPREVAAALQGDPTPNVGGGGGDGGVQVALRGGLRLEQIVAYLQTLPLENLDIEEFYGLATEPPADLRQEFEWMSVIPEGNSVEGFLGAGLFDVPPEIDARTMIETLLQRWEDSPQHQLIAEADERGKDFYAATILASITEREAILDEEKPLIAGVYQNRVDGVGGPGERTLNSEPVLIYAKDMVNLRDTHISQWPEYVFWTLDGLGRAADFEVPDDLAGFQVWRSRGLPPWPIATPGLASLEAALNPDQEDGYLYFLAKGDGTNGHVFARTYEEHLQNIETYMGVSSPDSTAEPSLGPLEPTVDPFAEPSLEPTT